MVRPRTRTPDLAPSPSADPASVRIAYAYLASATLWLLVGTAAGLLAALKLNWPDLLPYSFLSFGRIRPIHTNTVFWGWSSMALAGIALYVVPRTSRTTLWSPRLAWLALWLWHAAAVLGLVTLAAGITRGPQEYREWVWPVASLFGAGVVLNGVNVYCTIATRRIPEIYISNWYILGAFVWLSILFVTGYVPLYQDGLGNIVIQGYYMHTAVGMWFTMLALGLSYYAIPRLLGRPIYSYALGVLGFWTNMLFYTLIGAHHFIFSPVPWWLQTTAILFSVGMMVPVWTGAGNLLLTLRGGWARVRRSYALPFLFVGVLFYGIASLQGTLEAFRTANIYWHFTNFTVGHSHVAMYGFIAMVAWGAVYGLVPRLTGREPSPVAVGVHFWVAFVGFLVYVVSISIAGVLQGFSWVAGESFIASVIAAEPMWLWRTVGGILMVASHVVFAWNVWEMRTHPSAAPESAALEEQPA
ncbi:MAG: cbb3-type cytochrome c oxidase subunit I [Proteobacteria bacterium]|nr:cbb3-type cytochrome c oxidase subunit I [Pseudomonadota bacterium]